MENKYADCPLEYALEILGGKWKLKPKVIQVTGSRKDTQWITISVNPHMVAYGGLPF